MTSLGFYKWLVNQGERIVPDCWPNSCLLRIEERACV